MLISFIWLGKSKYAAYEELIDLYCRRLKHYCKYELIVLKELKTKSIQPEELKQKESQLFLSKINEGDYVILLDERGKQMDSIGLSEYLQKRMNASTGRVVFIIGGAYGVHSTLTDRADFIWSLSQLTLTHDMSRVLMLEQVYRSFTILRGEKYHNE